MSNSKTVLRQIEKGELYAYQVMEIGGRIHFSNIPLVHPDMMPLSIEEVRLIFRQNEEIERAREN